MDEPVPCKSRFGRKYAWKPDLPDQRDRMYAAPITVALPPRVDLADKCGPIEDQGALGSCTGHALGTCLEFVTTKTRDLSRLFIYWNERYIEGTVNEDGGAMIRTGAKVCVQLGAPIEALWPYRPVAYKQKPFENVFQQALSQRAKSFQSIYGILSMKSCLATGFPFTIGFSVYESFESDKVANTGVVPLPQPTESLLGGHAVVVVGYDDPKHMFKVRNSWGEAWGMDGYCYMPYSYLGNTQLAGDAWCLR